MESKPRKPTDATPLNNASRHHKWANDDFTSSSTSSFTWITPLSPLWTLTADFTKPSMSKLWRYVAHKMAEGRSVNEHINKMWLIEKVNGGMLPAVAMVGLVEEEMN